jgi:hypothetical protein
MQATFEGFGAADAAPAGAASVPHDPGRPRPRPAAPFTGDPGAWP